jgi:DNA-binding Lrp family transcriptional regulator
MNRGYVKLWRKTLDSAVFLNEALFKVFIWCLLRAAYKAVFFMAKTGRGISEVKLSPGSFLFGRDSAAKELNMPPSTLWKRILKLKKLGFLNIESDSHYSIISIVNWHIYQAEPEKGDSERNRQGTGKEHKEELKKEKKSKKEDKDYSSDSVEIGLSKYLFSRIYGNFPNTKEPNYQAWAKVIDLMLRIDKRTPEEIRSVITWAQGDSFWSKNILSTEKLRKQYDQLNIKKGGNNGNYKQSEPRSAASNFGDGKPYPVDFEATE